MNRAVPFELPRWAAYQGDGVPHVLAGSAAPALSLEALESLSNDPHATQQALDFKSLPLGLGTASGKKDLRDRVAELYDPDARITGDDVIIANATTGANYIALEALLSAGDHVIATFPCYSPLLDIPKALGIELSYWNLDFEKGWEPDLHQLKSLLKPSTKMIILNNPNNPTGYVLSTEIQREIVKIASERGITIFSDEIFRPLFHTSSKQGNPSSLVEHSSYDKIVATGSLSKCWGFSGARIGWIVTRNSEFRESFLNVRSYCVNAVSTMDEVVAKEVLSHRCKDNILKRYLDIVQQNLKVLQDFVDRHKDTVLWTRPTGGGTAFLRFINPANGRPVDDLEFCEKLKASKGVLFSPGSLCFECGADGALKGFVRLHLTAMPDTLQKAFGLVSQFLLEKEFTDIPA